MSGNAGRLIEHDLIRDGALFDDLEVVGDDVRTAKAAELPVGPEQLSEVATRSTVPTIATVRSRSRLDLYPDLG